MNMKILYVSNFLKFSFLLLLSTLFAFVHFFLHLNSLYVLSFRSVNPHNIIFYFFVLLQYGLPLKIVSYKELYGWTMDEIVKSIGLKNNCTFCGVFRRQVCLFGTEVSVMLLLRLSNYVWMIMEHLGFHRYSIGWILLLLLSGSLVRLKNLLHSGNGYWMS